MCFLSTARPGGRSTSVVEGVRQPIGIHRQRLIDPEGYFIPVELDHALGVEPGSSAVGLDQPGRKLNRTVRMGLSPLVSTRQIDCQVPSVSCPLSTGMLA